MKCDVVVVGAGPGGSMAARAAASAGLKVVLLEKRQEIGDPVRCAEGVSKRSLHRLVSPEPEWIASDVKGARIYAPDGKSIVMSEDKSGGEVGYVLERKVFDRGLAMLAAQAGATVLVKTRALGLLRRNGTISGVSALRIGEPLEIEAPLVIGADGVESKVGRWAGIDTALKLQDIESCAQFLVHDASIDEEYTEFFLGNNIAPSGYAWSFPKGEKLANIGLERARDMLATSPLLADMPELKVTFSAGLTGYDDVEELSTCIERADRALYRAKSEGRDRTVIDDASPPQVGATGTERLAAALDHRDIDRAGRPSLRPQGHRHLLPWR